MAIFISALMVVSLEVIGPSLISILFGEEFRGAGPVLRLLLPGVGFVCVRRVLAESLRGGGYPTATSIAEAVTGIAFLALIYPLMAIWELEGVATTVSVAEGLGLAVLMGAIIRTERRGYEQMVGAAG
jgi:O-antigen/teichoic acid export membrane protein